MQCPNEKCRNRALLIQAETDEISVQFNEDGKTIESVTYGEWYITDGCAVSCDACHWQGYYRDCKGPDDAPAASPVCFRPTRGQWGLGQRPPPRRA